MMVIVPKWASGPEQPEQKLTKAELANMVEYIRGGLLVVANCGIHDRIQVLHAVVEALVKGDQVSVSITKKKK